MKLTSVESCSWFIAEGHYSNFTTKVIDLNLEKIQYIIPYGRVKDNEVFAVFLTKDMIYVTRKGYDEIIKAQNEM